MWVSLFKTTLPGCVVHEPREAGVIEAVEGALGVRFPEELKSLLLETDGVMMTEQVTRFEVLEFEFIWSMERIQTENTDFMREEVLRKRYGSFDEALFFAGFLNGDRVFFRKIKGRVASTEVFLWNHETDHREKIAESLTEFVKQNTWTGKRID